MKALSTVAVAATVGLAACTQHAASGPGRWEATIIPATANSNEVVMEVNATTGATFLMCCGDTALSAISDQTGVPAGDYHLKEWGVADTSGNLHWNVYRIDASTGRMWVCSVGNAPHHWVELAGGVPPPK